MEENGFPMAKFPRYHDGAEMNVAAPTDSVVCKVQLPDLI